MSKCRFDAINLGFVRVCQVLSETFSFSRERILDSGNVDYFLEPAQFSPKLYAISENWKLFSSLYCYIEFVEFLSERKEKKEEDEVLF